MERVSEINSSNEELGLLVEEEIEVKRPNLYKVLMLNDDHTPMDFVVTIIQSIFGKSLEESTKIMFEVHNKGKGIAGVFTYDIARTKADQVHSLAEKNQYPLECVLEVESNA